MGFFKKLFNSFKNIPEEELERKFQEGYEAAKKELQAKKALEAKKKVESKKALDKLSLNDNSFTYEPENSDSLGHGFRCGFLGLLHMEIIRERLSREHSLDFLMTVPSVTYKVEIKNGDIIELFESK